MLNKKIGLILLVLFAFSCLIGCGTGSNSLDSMQENGNNESSIDTEVNQDNNEGAYLEVITVRGELLKELQQQVGYYEDGSIYTNGEAGFLIYGPYLPFAAGDYKLILEGEAISVEGALLEVVAEHGEKQLASFLISDAELESESTIIVREVKIEEPTDLIEIRVFVYAENEMRIDGYEFVKLGD